MEAWLAAALDYVPRWLDFQRRHLDQPGYAVAIAHHGRLLFEHADGYADLKKAVPLTPRHRFRVASHSKTFTAAGVLKLREADRVGLDDAIGRYVSGLHPSIARATVGQLLSHAAGIMRDGPDSGQFFDRKPFLDERTLRDELRAAPTLEANTRFKYSNHGFGLLGLLIEAVTGEKYVDWIQREIVDAAGLASTQPDVPLPRGTLLASGHSGRWPLGHRVVMPGVQSTQAMAPATGFVSTPADLACFFGQLAPDARRSVLSVRSRREMVRRQWRDAHNSLERYYGLGVMSGQSSGWDWFGHNGSFQGYLSRTSVLIEPGLAVSVVSNAIDGGAPAWVDGVFHILRTFERHGAPSRRTRDWNGRWGMLWNALDLVPMRERVLVAVPALPYPFTDAGQLAITGRDAGRIALAGGTASHGEPVRRVRTARGTVTEVWLGGARLVREAALAREMQRRYRRR